MTITIVTNNVPRFTLDAHELTPEERAQFDYLDWDALERGEDSRTFVRYRGDILDLQEFSADWGITRGTGLPEEFNGWHGYMSDSFFSGLLVRYADDAYGEAVVMGRFFS